MRNKSLLLLLAIVCGTLAAIGVSQWMQANTGGATTQMVEIYVTSQEVGEREELTPDKLSLEQWPVDRVPQGAIADIKELEGKFAKQALFAGEPILAMKLVDDKDTVIVPKGYRVVTMKADRDGGIGLLTQGDRVDVRAYFTKSELIPRTITKTILTGVAVFAIDGKTQPDEERRAGAARSVSLLIREADQEAWTYARKLGEVELNLGSPGKQEEPADVTQESESALEFLTWLDDLREQQDHVEVVETEDNQPVVKRAGPKKETWRVTKHVEGRTIVYEFTKGDPVPRIVFDSGDPHNGEGVSSDEPAPEDAEYLSGQDSPFFQPPNGEDGAPNFGAPRPIDD